MSNPYMWEDIILVVIFPKRFFLEYSFCVQAQLDIYYILALYNKISRLDSRNGTFWPLMRSSPCEERDHQGEYTMHTPTANPGMLSCILSSDSETEDGSVRQVRIEDRGGKQQYADVLIEGVPARGVIDSGAEVSIINGKLFARIAAVT